MEFRKYAAHEASGLVTRLVDGVSEKSVRDLQAVRHALDMVTGAVDTVLAGKAAPDHHDEITALVERLATAAESMAQQVVEQERLDAEVVADDLRKTLETQLAENNELTASLAQVRTDADRLRADLESEKKLAEQARADAARAEAARAQLEARSQKLVAARDNATAQLQTFEGERQELAKRVQVHAAEIETLKRARDERERSCQALSTKLDAAASAAATLRQKVEAAERETRRIRAEAEMAAQASVRAARAQQDSDAHAERRLAEQAAGVRRHATTFLSVSLDRLIAMYVSVASGATTDTVLAAIVEAMAVQFSRVALFRVQGNHLEGVRQVGFDLRADISQVLIPRTLDGLLTSAASSARIETRSAEQLAQAGGTPFGGGSPDFALALPIVIDGQPLAVVYADDSDQPHREFATAEVRLKYAQLLQCHAIPLLTRLSGEARALSELEEYAALLFEQLEHTYGSDFDGAEDAGDAERRQHLRENIEYARQLYAQRAAPQGPRAAALFEQRLVAAVDERRTTPFGRDLAVLLKEADTATNGEAASEDSPRAKASEAS